MLSRIPSKPGLPGPRPPPPLPQPKSRINFVPRDDGKAGFLPKGRLFELMSGSTLSLSSWSSGEGALPSHKAPYLAGQRLAALDALSHLTRLSEYSAILRAADVDPARDAVFQRGVSSAKEPSEDVDGGSQHEPDEDDPEGGHASPPDAAAPEVIDESEDGGQRRQRSIPFASLVRTLTAIHTAELSAVRSQLAEQAMSEPHAAQTAWAPAQGVPVQTYSARPRTAGSVLQLGSHGQRIDHFGGAFEVHAKCLVALAESLRARKSLLGSLSQAALVALLSAASVERHTRYASVWRQDSPALRLFVVVDGEVSLHGHDGRAVLLGRPDYSAEAQGAHVIGLDCCLETALPRQPALRLGWARVETPALLMAVRVDALPASCVGECRRALLLELLGSLRLFASLPRARLRPLVPLLQLEAWGPSQLVCAQGEALDKLVLLLKGSVVFYSAQPARPGSLQQQPGLQELGGLRAGQEAAFFHERALFEPSRAEALVVTVELTHALTVRSGHFAALLQLVPDLGERMRRARAAGAALNQPSLGGEGAGASGRRKAGSGGASLLHVRFDEELARRRGPQPWRERAGRAPPESDSGSWRVPGVSPVGMAVVQRERLGLQSR